MSFIQFESLIDTRQKQTYGGYRRSIIPVAILTGATVLGLVLLSGLLHFETLSVAPPTTTAISLRPEYPVSTFLYERGAFSWFIGVSVSVLGGGLTLAGLGLGCVAVTVGAALAGCVMGAVSAAFAVVATIQNSVTERRLRIAQQTMIYMDYADKSARRSIDSDGSFDHRGFLDSVFGFGSEYQFSGHITQNDTRNGHLVAKNNGSHVPVFSFTTPHGIQLHHAIIQNEAGGNFHRFGFNTASNITKRASTDPIATSEEYFTSGGIDILDCQADDSNHLFNNVNDNQHMQEQIRCSVPNFNDATELAVQVYDATTRETIAAGRIAPFDASGKSELLDSDFSSCPSGLPNVPSCGMEADSD